MHDWTLTPDSSHVAAISFEVAGNLRMKSGLTSPLYKTEYGSLYVAFKNGKVYEYEGVSALDWDLIRHAQSTGRALHRLGVTSNRGRKHVLVGRFDPETGVAEPSR